MVHIINMPYDTLFMLMDRLWAQISNHRRIQLGGLLLLMVVTAFAEVLSIGAVLPFLGALTAPEDLFRAPILQPIMHWIGFTTATQLLLPLTIIFGIAVIVAGSMRLLLLWATASIAHETGAELGSKIYRHTLYQPYLVHLARNSSQVITGISNKVDAVIGSIIVPLLTLLSGVIMFTFILVALFYIQPYIALGAFLGFGFIYGFIVFITRKRLLANSKCISVESTKVIKSLQEGLGGIRDVLIDGSQEVYSRIYQSADCPLRKAQGNNLFISQSPRYISEALGMLLIAFLAYALARQPDGVSKAIPILGALALGAQRLLPVMQQIYGSWATIQGGRVSLRDTLDLLEQPLPVSLDRMLVDNISFEQRIILDNISFDYGQQKYKALKNINLTILKGSRTGIIGKTGSGKSTLLDVVMGLLQPTMGNILIDNMRINEANNRSWQARIAHVPQSIFLADSSVLENIAFGIPVENIDFDRARRAAIGAQIAETIETWSNGYDTIVGERGVRMSGGQRQRIGIARALYKQADVVIFDEATSALDEETEEAVMQAIEGLNKNLTLIIIAHRLSTLRNCNQIIELKNGEIDCVGSYEELCLKPEKFHVK